MNSLLSCNSSDEAKQRSFIDQAFWKFGEILFNHQPFRLLMIIASFIDQLFQSFFSSDSVRERKRLKINLNQIPAIFISTKRSTENFPTIQIYKN